MVKKTNFSKLSLGSDNLIEGLEILNKDVKTTSYNPLKDTKKGKSTKPGARPARIKPTQVAAKLRESKPEDAPIPVVEKDQSSTEPALEEVIKETAPRKESRPVKKISQVVHSVREVSDFRTHSALFSASQLNQLRQLVYRKKAEQQPDYKIKDALYEAFSDFLVGRKPCGELPDDFKSYTAQISDSQLHQLKTFVYEMKSQGEYKYSMMRAVYEAIGMYLGKG